MTRRYIRSRRRGAPRRRSASYAPIRWCRTNTQSAIIASYGHFHTPRIDELMRDFGMSRASAYRWRAWYVMEMTRQACAMATP